MKNQNCLTFVVFYDTFVEFQKREGGICLTKIKQMWFWFCLHHSCKTFYRLSSIAGKLFLARTQHSTYTLNTRHK